MKSAASRPQVTRDGPLTFEIQPEIGLKNEHIEFELGMPLNQVIVMLQQNCPLISDIKLKFAKKSPFVRPICIELSNDGIKLSFDAVHQLLTQIDVDELSKLTLMYKNKVFSGPCNDASLDRAEDFFGSTHPGAYDERHKMYVQSWPGLSLYFPSTGNVQVAPGPGFTPNLNSLKYDENDQMRMSKLSIFKGSSPNKAEVNMPSSCFCGQNKTSLVKVMFEKGRVDSVEIKFQTQKPPSSPTSDDDFEIVEVTRNIRFGDDVSAVMTALGAPTKVFYKSEDKMSIHRGSKEPQTHSHPNVPVPHFFFNYFSMGFDILFDYFSKRVIKFVFHTNFPGHYDFGIYNRCPFEITVNSADSKETMTFNHLSKFQYQEMMSVFPDEFQQQPVISRRRDDTDQNPFGPTYHYGVHQLIVEIMENQHIAAVTIYADYL